MELGRQRLTPARHIGKHPATCMKALAVAAEASVAPDRGGRNGQPVTQRSTQAWAENTQDVSPWIRFVFLN
jgi:hypothetical protein